MSPLASLSDAVARAPRGAVIALSRGDHSAPAIGLEDLELAGACAGATRIIGRLRLGDRAQLRDVRLADGAEVRGVGVELARVLADGPPAEPTLVVGAGATLAGTSVYARGNAISTVWSVASASVSLDGWGVDGGGVGLSASRSTLSLSRGVVGSTTLGLEIVGGPAQIVELDVDRPRGPDASARFAIVAREGAEVRVEGLLADGAVMAEGSRTQLELRRARVAGLQARAATISARDVRVLDGLFRVEGGARADLQDVVRILTGPPILTDEVLTDGHVDLHRARFVDSAFQVQRMASATIEDLVTTADPALGLRGVFADGDLTASRLSFEGQRDALWLKANGQVRDLSFRDVHFGVLIGAEASATVTRASMRGTKGAAIATDAPAVLSDIDVADTISADEGGVRDRSTIELVRGAVLTRARVDSYPTQYYAVWVHGPGRSTLSDLDLSSSSLAPNPSGGPESGAAIGTEGVGALDLSRVRVRGRMLDGVLRSSPVGLILGGEGEPVSAQDVDVELPRTSLRLLWLTTPGRASVERFRLVGGSIGARVEVRDVDLSMSNGLFDEQPEAAMSVPQGYALDRVLDGVRVIGPAPRFLGAE